MGDNSLLIKSFVEQRGDYEHLCQEVAYILKKAKVTADVWSVE